MKSFIFAQDKHQVVQRMRDKDNEECKDQFSRLLSIDDS
jgi:hypothetical protein